jgi:hypothetical protein
MSEAPLAPTCRECGATNDVGASECWLCQGRNWKQPPGPRDRRPAPDRSERGSTPAIGGWLLLCAVIAVGIGLFREAPGVAIFLLVSLAPALFVTEMRVIRLRGRGDSMPDLDRIAMVILLMIVIPILVVLALGVGFFTICFGH